MEGGGKVVEILVNRPHQLNMRLNMSPRHVGEIEDVYEAEYDDEILPPPPP
jgi:hypothetical protein